MTSSKSERLAAWHARAELLLDEALAVLVEQDESPLADGVLGEWTRQLARFRFSERHVAPVVTLVRKRDPLLCEAGLVLATSLLERNVHAAPDVDAAVAAVFDASPVDPWILEAIATLASRHAEIARFPLTYRRLVVELAAAKPIAREARIIMRNRAIAPHQRFIELFEHHILSAHAQTERERLVLPLVEAALGTRGFEATREAIARRFG